MSDGLALLMLYDAVSTSFTADGITNVSLAFGWKAKATQVTGPRIIMVPGDEGGSAGEIEGARYPGRNPRPLASFAELFHVVVSGAGDAADPTNERKAYAHTRLLFDAWFRAARKWAGNQMTFVSAQWINERTTARFGTALIVTFTMDAMIPDVVYPTDLSGLTDVEPVSADMTALMLDHSESVYVEIAEYIATEGGLVIGTEGGEELQYDA